MGAYILIVPFMAYSVAISTGWLKIFEISSRAMEPTVSEGDHLSALRFRPGPADLRHDQVIIFKADGLKAPGDVTLKGEWVERIIALPGDVVSLNEKTVQVNGRTVERDGNQAVPPLPLPSGNLPSFPLTVPPDHVFLLGDNFLNSLDSRYLGTVEISRITYRPIHRLLPVNRSGKIE